jgi:hypothetical protein
MLLRDWLLMRTGIQLHDEAQDLYTCLSTHSRTPIHKVDAVNIRYVHVPSMRAFYDSHPAKVYVATMQDSSLTVDIVGSLFELVGQLGQEPRPWGRRRAIDDLPVDQDNYHALHH